MKVVHLIASSGLYGAEKWILALMRAMEGSGVQSVLVNFSDEKEHASAVVRGACDRGLNAIDFYTGGTFNPFAIVKFSHWLKQNRIDVVHGHGYKSDIIGVFSSKLANCKILSTPHGWSKGENKKLLLYERLDRIIFRFMDHVCPLSEELFESVQEYVSPSKLRLIANAVDIDEINTYQPAFKKGESEFIVGYVGRLVSGKDIPTLISAFKFLREELASLSNLKPKLMIVGDGDCLPDLRLDVESQGLSNDVEFLGFRSDAISYLKCFDVFVLPSLSEGVPRCLMESMACGVITVASKIRGNLVLVEHGKTGFLFEPGDSGALFLILKDIILNNEKCYDAKVNAKRLIENSFSNRRMAKDYQLLYERLVSEKTNVKET